MLAALCGFVVSVVFGLGATAREKIGAYAAHLNAAWDNARDGAAQQFENHEEDAT